MEFLRGMLGTALADEIDIQNAVNVLALSANAESLEFLRGLPLVWFRHYYYRAKPALAPKEPGTGPQQEQLRALLTDIYRQIPFEEMKRESLPSQYSCPDYVEPLK
jgi:hypothetical protein